MNVNMNTKRVLVAATVVILLVIPATFAGKGKPFQTGLPLNVEFADGLYITDDVGKTNPTTGMPNAGPYSDGLENVRAEFYVNQFYLDTNENKGDLGRRVNIDFHWGDETNAAGTCPDPRVGDTGIPCPQGGPLDVYIATISGADPGQLTVDEPTTLKHFAIKWVEGPYWYHLRHNGIEYDAEGNPVGDDRHGMVIFTCTAFDAAGKCTDWTASPTGGTEGTVALYANPTRGNTANEVYLGSLTMPFVMTMTKK